MSQRLRWIDIAKALAIILMVVGHSSIPSIASHFIYAFHMPLFFIASGWTTNWNKYSFGDFVKRRCRSLLFPFFFYSVIVLLIQVHYGWMTMDEWLIKGWGDGYALWFVPVLFMASIIARLLYVFKDIGGGRLFWVALVLVLCLGIDLHCCHIRLPWSLSSVPYAVFMIVMGSEWSHLDFTFLRKRTSFVAIFALFIVLAVSHYWRLDMCFNNIMPILPLTIGAFSGTIMVFIVANEVAMCFKRLSRVLIFVGKETYVIVAFSQITIMLLNHFFLLNPAIKYLILVLVLLVVGTIKNIVNRSLHINL